MDQLSGLKFQPTILTPGVLGVDRSRAAWQRTIRDYLQNPIPIELRVGLLCAAWEGRGGPSSIHATGISLLGHESAPINLDDVWSRMMGNPETQQLAAITRQLALGQHVPEKALRNTLQGLGQWATAWQDLVGYASWVDALHRVNMPSLSPLEDERLDGWLGQLVQAGAHYPRFTGSVSA